MSSHKTTRKNINDNENIRNVMNENTNEKTNMNTGRHYEYEMDTTKVINKKKKEYNKRYPSENCIKRNENRT